MKRKYLAWLLVLMLLPGILALPAAAEGTEGDNSQPPPASEEVPENSESAPETQAPETPSPTAGTLPPESGEGDTDPGEATTPPTEGGSTGVTECAHDWYYVEVEPTCTEYGATGYYCILCEAVSEAKPIDLLPHSYDNACDESCNVCGGTRTIEHKYSTQWSRNSRKHWHACTVCGVEEELLDHYPGPAATEERDQYCLTCGLLMTKRLAHTHKFASERTYDETGHWYACSGCEEKKDFMPHSMENLCDPDCADCDYTCQTSHHFGDVHQADGDGHWRQCSVCGLTEPVEAHVPGKEATETSAQLCSVCGYRLAPPLAHAHQPQGDWVYDEENHWQLCQCGEPVAKDPHRYDDGQEGENGMVFTCLECGAEITEPMEAVAEEEASILPWILIALVAAGALVVVVIVFNLRRVFKRKGRFG